MRDLTEDNVTDAVLNTIAADTNPRLKTIMEALVRHSHDSRPVLTGDTGSCRANRSTIPFPPMALWG